MGVKMDVKKIFLPDSKNKELASKAVQPLWESFGKVIEPMQIDILYFIGDAGIVENIPLLESVTNGNHRKHVKAAAEEAIASIRSRHHLN